MPSKNYDKKINEEIDEQKKIRKQLDKTHNNIIKTIKDREKVEMEYLNAVNEQMKYWKDQINKIDAEKDKERYDELKKNIKMEEAHIKLIQEELDRINKEIKIEEENKNK